MNTLILFKYFRVKLEFSFINLVTYFQLLKVNLSKNLIKNIFFFSQSLIFTFYYIIQNSVTLIPTI